MPSMKGWYLSQKRDRGREREDKRTREVLLAYNIEIERERDDF
jgi:hypothetical protein